MPVITSYTEAELADWILSEAVLGNVGATLGWTTQADVQNIINAALRAYGGISTIDQATDTAKLEAITRQAAWAAAVNGLITYVDFSVDGESVSRSDMLQGALDALARAETAAAEHTESAAYSISVATVVPSVNPYDYSRVDAEVAEEWAS